MKSEGWQLILESEAARLQAHAGQLILMRGGPGKSAWLQRLAGLAPLPAGITMQFPCKEKPVVRLRPDRHPPLWLGTSIREEMTFGLDVSEARMREAMRAWHLDALDPDAPVDSLDRLHGLWLTMAAMQLADADLLLLDAPSDSLSAAQARTFAEQISHWLALRSCIVVLSANRWQDWLPTADACWNVSAADSLPEAIAKEAPGD